MTFKKSIEQHIKIEHNMSNKNYKQQYPKSKLRISWNAGLNKNNDIRVLKNSEKALNNHWSKNSEKSQEIKNKISKKNKGKKRSEKFIENLKSKTKEKNNNYGKKWSEKNKKNFSDKKKKFYIDNPEVKEKIKQNHWSKKEELKKDIIERHKNLMAILISSGKINLNTGYKTGWYKSEKMKQEFYYMSSYELIRMNFLENSDDVISYTKNHNIIIEYNIEGSVKKYIPDFLIELNDGSIILEEVKGYINKKNVFKLKCEYAKRFCEINNYVFQIVFKNNLNQIKTNINTYDKQ